jgi:hypothetical protein
MKITNEAASAMADAFDALFPAGKFRILTGSAPATADAAETGTLLAEFTLGNPTFGAAANGVLVLTGAPLTVAAVATGTAGYWRSTKAAGSGSPTAQGSIGTSGTDAIINSVSIVIGADVVLTSWGFTQPKG